MLPSITGHDNDELKRLAKLARGRERRRQGRFVVEGRRAIGAFLEAGWQPEQILIADAVEVPAAWPHTRSRRIGERALAKIAHHVTSSGYLAEFAIPPPPRVTREAGGLVAVGVGDPGNLGTLIRGAAACGLGQVVTCGGADPYGPKVVQASAGALARVAVIELDEAAIGGLQSPAVDLVALVVHGGEHPAAFVGRPAWLVVGSEGAGLSATALAACRRRLTLPMPGAVESLNAGVAGVLACYLLQGLHLADL